PYDIAFVDIRMPGPSGLEILERLKSAGYDTCVIIVTAESTLANAIEAMKRGAFDYLTKPLDLAQVDAITEKAIRGHALLAEIRALRRELGARYQPERGLIGRSLTLQAVFKTIGKVAQNDVPVLIQGESGTGKELVARTIHYASSRAERPFVAVNSAAVPKTLMESELFGHEKGAFTDALERRAGRFELADGGTIFFDEIGDMPADLQAKLLRVLQDGEFDPLGSRKPVKVNVRTIAATNRDIERDVREGRFREDLFYRLNVVVVKIPPLRDRPEDIDPLADHFLERYREELGTGPKYFSEEAKKLLRAYRWPGNVRELENAIRRALALSTQPVLLPEDFDQIKKAPMGRKLSEEVSIDELIRHKVRDVMGLFRGETEGGIHRTVLRLIERPLIETVLERTGGNQIRAARILGINRNTLRKKIVELKIEVRRGSE
ncbi:MAG: sigma-54-dependent transcriptional regulator, partial [Vicinamibacteria bacterium]